MIRFGLSPDSSSMLLNDPMHTGQADAGAFTVVGTMPALKYAKQLIGILHVEAHSGVANEDDCGAAFLLDGSYLDDRMCAWARVLQRVGQQVLKDLSQQVPVALERWQGRDSPFHIAPLVFRLEKRDHFIDNVVQAHYLQLQGL